MANFPAIVCDSSVLIRLRKGNALSCLPALFERVIIPEAVYRESKDPATRRQIERYDFEVHEVKEVLFQVLGRGEQEVITLAVMRNISVIATDDDNAFKKAKQNDLQTLSSFDLLLLAKDAKIVPNIKPILDRMREAGEGKPPIGRPQRHRRTSQGSNAF